MNPINTHPIEVFLEKERIASKSGQKTLVLDIRDARALAETIAVVMTRLVAKLDQPQPRTEEQVQVRMDGGVF